MNKKALPDPPDTPIDHLVREIFEITRSLYWEDRAAKVKELIKEFISNQFHIDIEPND